MKLYYSPGACSLVPHILLRETGLPFELVAVDLPTHRTKQEADYYAINAKGAVPLLELDSGERLSEGPIIAQWICDKAGRTDLMPAAGTMARYRVMEWQNYITAELHKSVSPLFRPDVDHATKDAFRTSLRKKFEWVSGCLQNNAYLTGTNFTAADAYLFVVANWSGVIRVNLADLAPLQQFSQRVLAREAVQAAMKAEGLIKQTAA